MTEYNATLRTTSQDLTKVLDAVAGRVSHLMTSTTTNVYVECELREDSDMAALDALHRMVDPTGAEVREIRVRPHLPR